MISSDPGASQYLPQNYRRVPYNRRPLAMRIFERTAGQPMEEILALLWYKYRSVNALTRTLNVNVRTTRRWIRNLGLYICIKCSKDTGLLISDLEAQKCDCCGGYLCLPCQGKEPIEHKVSGVLS